MLKLQHNMSRGDLADNEARTVLVKASSRVALT
jgi:hypothetical protein